MELVQEVPVPFLGSSQNVLPLAPQAKIENNST